MLETGIWGIVDSVVLKCPAYPLASAEIQPACHMGRAWIRFAGLLQRSHTQDNRHSPEPLGRTHCISCPANVCISALISQTAPCVLTWPTVDTKDIVFALFPPLIQFSTSHRRHTLPSNFLMTVEPISFLLIPLRSPLMFNKA